MAVGEPHQALEVFVDDQQRLPRLPQPLQALPDLLAHQRREPLGRLVQDQQVRVGHQRAADGEHLLLAARKLVAHVVRALGEPREKLEHSAWGPGIGPRRAVAGKRDQILAHREVGKDLPPFGHQRNAGARDAIGRLALDALAAEADRSAFGARQAHDGAHGGGLAHAVTAQQCRCLAGLDLEIQLEEHLTCPVGGLEIPDLQHQAATSSPR